jgi:hypothetical protein
MFGLEFRHYLMWLSIPVLVVIVTDIIKGLFPDEGSVEYWILPEFHEAALEALQSEGWKYKTADEKSSLFSKRGRFRRLFFAILTVSPSMVILEVPWRYSAQIDAYITPHMLTGGARYYRRLLGRSMGKRKPYPSET